MIIPPIFRRLRSFVAFEHAIILVQTASIIVTSILLAGCSSYSPMTNVYVLEISYTNSTPSDLSPVVKKLSETLNEYKGASQLEVRVGYFGTCVRRAGVFWFCSADAKGLAQQIGSENDPLNLIGMASKFKDDVLFSGLLLMAVILAFFTCCLLATFPGWHEERDAGTGSEVDVKPFPSRPVLEVSSTSAVVAALLCLVASLWQHVGSVGAATMSETANYGNVKAEIGTSAVVMGWVSFSLMTISAIGVVCIMVSIRVLDRLTDD
ncbi:hypothetical protein CC80DRAFT_530744 [Byssothecium circinans]|uniref:Membrane fusion mating protein FIG1 n=1 Tax=Byssothecium circinans TaxID=147558 RepID=A0A6A5UCE0_9PLEO|nr:hypothetical protein CC80DRAFT_530744 [Byssothecium circinans]